VWDDSLVRAVKADRIYLIPSSSKRWRIAESVHPFSSNDDDDASRFTSAGAVLNMTDCSPPSRIAGKARLGPGLGRSRAVAVPGLRSGKPTISILVSTSRTRIQSRLHGVQHG
jgi:hypothetical protein